MRDLTVHFRIGLFFLSSVMLASSARANAICGDYNGDRGADLVVYSPAASSWYMRALGGLDGINIMPWSGADYVAITGDFDGDRILDPAAYQASTGKWQALLSGSAYAHVQVSLGGSGWLAVPADFDGDGKTDPAIYRTDTGEWWVFLSTLNYDPSFLPWPDSANGQPIPDDFDGDNKADPAVYLPASGEVIILYSAMNYAPLRGATGLAKAQAVTGDFDSDGNADFAVAQPSAAECRAFLSGSDYAMTTLALGDGTPGTIVAGDLDVDGKCDLAIYHDASQTWQALPSAYGYAGAIIPCLPASLANSAVLRNTAAFSLNRVCGLDAAGESSQRNAINRLFTADTTVPAGADQDYIPMTADYDGDRMADMARYYQARGEWQIQYSASKTTGIISWGGNTLIPVRGDFDGDGKADVAAYWPDYGLWCIVKTDSNLAEFIAFGNAATTPVPMDYDGDQITDLAVVDAECNWYAMCSSNGHVAGIAWGWQGTIPIPADYDDDGKADPAVFDAQYGLWHIWLSASQSTVDCVWGWRGVTPLAQDFTGDGKADLAFYWPDGGCWQILRTSDGSIERCSWQNAAIRSQGYPANAAVVRPVAGDFDGNGCAEMAVFHRGLGLELRQGNDIASFVAGWCKKGMSWLMEGVGDWARDQAIGWIVKFFGLEGESETVTMLKEMDKKLDQISTKLDQVVGLLDDVLYQINYTHDDLNKEIWNAQLSVPCLNIKALYTDLQSKFTAAAFTNSTLAARAQLASDFIARIKQQDVETEMFQIHKRIVGDEPLVHSALQLWTDVLTDKIQGGSDVFTCYQGLEAFFNQMLIYQLEGSTLIVEQYHQQYGTNSTFAADYIRNTYQPRLEQQVNVFLDCVDQLVACSADLKTEIGIPVAVELPFGAKETYRRADFIASLISTNHPWGLSVRLVGDPDHVAAVMNSVNCNGALAPISSRQYGKLTWPQAAHYYPQWTFTGTPGSYTLKTVDKIAVVKYLLTNVSAQTYNVGVQPSSGYTRGGSYSANVARYNNDFTPLQATDTNGQFFGNCVATIRQLPQWTLGPTNHSTWIIGPECLSFNTEYNLPVSGAWLRQYFMLIKDTPPFILDPSAHGETSLQLTINNQSGASRTIAMDAAAMNMRVWYNNAAHLGFGQVYTTEYYREHARLDAYIGDNHWGPWITTAFGNFTGGAFSDLSATNAAGTTMTIRIKTSMYGSLTSGWDWHGAGNGQWTDLTLGSIRLKVQ